MHICIAPRLTALVGGPLTGSRFRLVRRSRRQESGRDENVSEGAPSCDGEQEAKASWETRKSVKKR